MPLNHEGRNKNTSRKKTCTHCGKTGHTVDVCYRKHGYPPGYKPYNGRTVNNVVAIDGKPEDDHTQHHESQDLVRFSPEQYKALLALIQRPTAGNTTSDQTKQVASVIPHFWPVLFLFSRLLSRKFPSFQMKFRQGGILKYLIFVLKTPFFFIIYLFTFFLFIIIIIILSYYFFFFLLLSVFIISVFY